MAKLSGKTLIAAAIALGTAALIGASASAARFTLREYNGKIALFYDGDDEPSAVYQTQLNELYPADRELLEKGISLNSYEELRRLIEDLDLE